MNKSSLFIGLGVILVIAIAAGAYALAGPYWQKPTPSPSPVATTTDTEAVASSTPVTAPAATTTRAYGTVTLSLGEKAVFKEVTTLPVAILEDSRCATDVQCVWAGQVRVSVNVIDGTSATTTVLKIGDTFTGHATTVTLVLVTPEKHSGSQINASQYRLTFTVIHTGTVATKQCYVGGCSSELCTDASGAVSSCIYRSSYACYKTARCERQQSGACGWTDTPALKACLLNPPQN